MRRLAGVSAAGQWQALVIAVVGYAFLLRLVYASQVELLPEEAYYWSYSRHLDFGYLDHPPLVAWLIRLGTSLFGDTEFGVRFGAVICGVTTSVFLFRVTRNLFDEPAALLSLLLSQVLPFFFMSGLLMTPDAPLTAAWAASLYFLERALIAGRASEWLWVGLSLGVGLLAKYTIALLGIATLLFMLLDPVSRRWFRRWEPYAAALVAVAVFSPVILWNSQHEWASFAFQTSRRLADRPRFSLHKLIAGAMVLITPTGLIAVAAAIIQGPPPGLAAAGGLSMHRRWRLLSVCVLVPVAVFLCFSLRHEVKLDWTGAPWVAAVPLLAVGIAARRLKGAWPPTLCAVLLIYGVGLYYLVLGVPGVGYSEHTELVPVEWRDFARQIDDVAADLNHRHAAQVLVVGMDRYAIASELAFYGGGRSPALAATCSAHLFGDMGLMYEQWCPAAAQVGRTLLLVAWDAPALADARLAGQVASLDAIHQGTLLRNGHTVRHYYYRVAHGYRPIGPKGT